MLDGPVFWFWRKKMTESKFEFPTTTVEKVESNIIAIRLLKQLDKEGKLATPEQQIILSKYVGWGGLANAFFKGDRFKKEREELQNLVSDEEYRSMEMSSLTAYYTDPMIASEMWQYLVDNGFKGGNILDPAMGTGIFFATMPKFIRENSILYGIELDSLTGSLAKQLHQDAVVLVQGFETVDFTGTPFDLVITNVPFADIRLMDEVSKKPTLIHDYFIKKSIRITRKNGVVAVITSTGTVDKRSGSILPELKEQSSFLGGVRLPNDAFKKIAGTTVTSDILFFQKGTEHQNYFVEKIFSAPQKSSLDDRIFVNPFFLKEAGLYNPYVLGNYTVRYFNGATLSLKANSNNLKLDLQKALAIMTEHNYIKGLYDYAADEISINGLNSDEQSLIAQLGIRLHEYACDSYGNIYYRSHDGISKSSRAAEMIFYQDETGNFSHWDSKYSEKVVEDFMIAYKQNPQIITNTYISSEPSKKGANKGFFKCVHFYEKGMEEKENQRIRGMVDIKNAYQDVIDIQETSNYDNEEFEYLLSVLNDKYDEFVYKYGYINTSVNSRLFERDDRYPLIASLEEEALDESDSTKVVYKKSDAFRKPMVRPKKALKIVSTAVDALNTSLSEGGGVDFELMLAIYPNSTKKSVIAELGDRVLIDPQQYQRDNVVAYKVKEEVLSGDVRTKKEITEKLIEQGDSTADWEHYLKLLNQVIPEDILISDISFNLGSSWIPNNVVGMFAYHFLAGDEDITLGDYEADNVVVSTKLGRGLAGDFISYTMNRPKNIQSGLRNASTYRYSRGHDILSYLLGSDQPTITKDIGTKEEPKRVVDEVATAELRKAELYLQEGFKNFVLEHKEVMELVESVYNNTFNRRVTRTYDGSHLVINGLVKGASLRPHQLNAVQRIIEDKRALLAHEVGSGKSLTMVSAGFKLKDLGLVNKPLYVVPSSLTAQFGQEILRFFPTRKVFVTTEQDFEKTRRRLFISRIITGDYDAIVMGHSQFEKIKVSYERERLFYSDKLDELSEIIQFAEANDDRISFKQAQAMKARLEKQMEKMSENKKERSDEFIDFESLGIDMLFVDEAHKFKNVRPVTKLGNVAGIGQTTAQKNLDMEMKIRSIQNEHGGTNVVFATGTPVSNSISEMYTMMNYIQPDILDSFGMSNFDAWVGTFGIIENSLELNPTGDKYISRKRFAKFMNLPELMQIYKMTADVQMTEDLDLPVPKEERIAIKSELTDAQKKYLNLLVARSEAVKDGKIDPSEDNMLKITSEARKLALDMRLLNSDCYSIADNNKMMQVVDRVSNIYHREEKNRGTQIIFSDLGTPTAGSSFTIYQELKNLLIERGVAEEEIAFIHSANNKKARLQLQRQMNSGEIRILLASTEKGGTGLNVQRRLKAVHHLDVPWKPSDIIQRNGRIVRQGNIYRKVSIFHYITTGSFDNYLWQIQETKLRYITQIMTSKTPVRAADDIDEQTMTASDFKAIATGNPYLKLKMELDNEFELLTSRYKAWKRDYRYSKRKMEQAQNDIELTKYRLERIQEDISKANATKHRFDFVDGKKTEINPFLMTFENGIAIDKKDAAGNQLHYDMQMAISENPEFITLAYYRGFKLRVKTHKQPYINNQIMDLKIVGANQYNLEIDFSSPVGTIQRIDNLLNALVAKENEYHRDEASLQVIIDRGLASETFSDQERLNYISAKRNVINPLIQLEENTESIEAALAEFEKDYGASHGQIFETTIPSIDRYSEVEDEEESELVEDYVTEAEVVEAKPNKPKLEISNELSILLQEFLSEAEAFLNNDEKEEKSTDFNEYSVNTEERSVKQLSIFETCETIV